jgi:Permuted papain-like amidase enzyme, YaeF/YiiX, C92 family
MRCSLHPILLAAQLVIVSGCAAVHRDARRPVATPVLVDPLAMNAETSSMRLASLSTEGLRAVDESILKLFQRDRVDAWNNWARANLRDGDIVFLQSNSNWVWGFIELSQLTQDVTDSPFTHVAVAAIEEGNVVLYDIDTPGPGRTPFGIMMASHKTAAVAVKRLRPEFQPYIPRAIQYCRDVYASQLAFDKQLKLDNDRLYCAELVEVAFRKSGLELSKPTRWDALPGLDQHPIAVSTIAWVNETQPDEFVIVPGNDRFGIWSSPGLDLVLPLTDAKKPPAALLR